MSTVFEPNYVVHPGETLAEWIEEDGMTQVELATRIGISEKALSQILNGVAPITPETALSLEFVTKVPARTWNSLQALFAEDTSRLNRNLSLENQIDFLFTMPLSDLRKRGFVTSKRRDAVAVREVCDFFGVADPRSWARLWTDTGVAYRKSEAFKANPESVATWLRLGELAARSLDIGDYNKSKLKTLLPQMRSLSLEPDPSFFIPALQRLCASAGVAFVVIPEITGARCSGATRWISRKPIVQLSLRHKSDDHLWFTFFHELGHVLLHGHKSIFIEGNMKGSEDDEQETQANTFARNQLIPDRFASDLASLKTLDSITEFAARVGVSPGIVVGRLQHDQLIGFKVGNGLKARYRFTQ